MNIQNSKIEASASSVIPGFVVVAPSSMSGWRVVAEPFYEDAHLARITAARFPDALVLPASIEHTTESVRGRVLQRHKVDVDWKSCTQPSARNPERWYAVRVAPGMQRMAAAITGNEGETPAQAAEREHRRGETVVERNLRNEGFDVYMPAFWQEIRQHRSRKLVERRYPLLVGYAFIRRDPRLGFDPIREVDGVSSVVRIRESDGPAEFREEDIQPFMIEMFKRELRYRYERLYAIEHARHKRTKHLYAELGRMLPRGRSKTEGLRAQADRVIESLADGRKERVLGIIAQLNAMDDDHCLDKFRAAI